MISRVVGEKVDKKCQALLLPPGSVAGLPPLGPAAGTPGAGLLGMAGLPPLKPGAGAGTASCLVGGGGKGQCRHTPQLHRSLLGKTPTRSLAGSARSHPYRAFAGQPAGQQSSGVLMAGTPGQQPQLVLLPPALMAQQMAAVAGGMGLALQQTPQGLQMVQRPLDSQGGAAGQQGASPPNGAQ